MCSTTRSLKQFERWMKGTCIPTPAQRIPGEDEPFQFSFLTDVLRHPDVLDILQLLSSNMKTNLTAIQKYFERFKKYKAVWRTHKDKASVLVVWCKPVNSLAVTLCK